MSDDPKNFKNFDAKEMFVWADKMPVPDWIDKGEAKECGGCKKKLKSGDAHNCRLCGQLFCSDCTAKFQLPTKFEKKGKGNSRVCAACCRKCVQLKVAVSQQKDVAKQEAIIRASAAPEPQFVQTHLSVVWEDAPSKVVCSVPIVESMPLQRIHQSITRTYALNEGTFHYLCRGQPVHKLFWDIFTAKYVAPTLILRKAHSGPVEDAGDPNAIKAPVVDNSKAAALEQVDWAAINKAEEEKKAKAAAEAQEPEFEFLRPTFTTLAEPTAVAAKVSAPPAGFKLEETKQKPKEIPKDFKQEKEPVKAPEPIVFVKADGLPKTVQFVASLNVLAVAANGLPALPPPPPGFEAYQKSAPPSTLPGMPSDFKLLMPNEIAAATAAGTAINTGSGGSGGGGGADEEEEDDGIDDGPDDASAPTLSAEQLKEAELQKSADDDGGASEDDEPVPAPKRITAIPAPPPKRPVPGAPTGPVPGATPPNPQMAAAPRPSVLPVSPVQTGTPQPAGTVISPTNAGARASVMPNAQLAAAIAAQATSPTAKPMGARSSLIANPNAAAAGGVPPPFVPQPAAPTPTPAPPPVDPDALAPGWTEHTNPADGRKYYHNKATKVSTFDRPTIAKMAPPAPAAATPPPAPQAASAPAVNMMAAAAAAAVARRGVAGMAAGLAIPMRLPGSGGAVPTPMRPTQPPGPPPAATQAKWAAAAAQPIVVPKSIPAELKAEIHAPPARPAPPPAGIRAPPPPPARRIDKFQASAF